VLATLGLTSSFTRPPGGAAGDFRLSSGPSGANHNPTPPLGWTAGVGVEYAFNDAISVKLEYLYVDLLTVSCPAGTLCSANQAATTTVTTTGASGTFGSVSFTENLIRAGVNYKFSW
jgi:outer membrane immunogenic protein